jgi:8-oxo-dGTP pyrophosphatase MutT (NUDIX family)
MFKKNNEKELVQKLLVRDEEKIKVVQNLISPLQNLNKQPLKELKARESAVLILLYYKGIDLFFCLTQRTKYKGVHSGQISLPGGKKEIYDIDLMTTAIRETQEEIGIEINPKEIICTLNTIYIAPSNFIVTPYIALHQQEPLFIKEDKEVDEIIEIPISELLNASTILDSFTTSNNLKIKAQCYVLQNKKVWGATAAILAELKTLLS